MNLRQLETYLWVAKLGSFSRTAERLFTTQPAISTRISNLEDELQVTLFSRDGATVRLTDAGRALMPLAEEALGAVEAIRERAGVSDEDAGLLRLGVSETLVQTWLPELLGMLRDTYPQLDVEITVDVTSNLRNELVDHSLDLAFLLGPVSEYTVTNVPLSSYDMIWAMRPPEATDGPLSMTLDEVRAFPILTFARTTRPYTEVHQEIRERTGITPRIFPCSSMSACRRMTELGVGVGALPRALIQEQIESGRLIEVLAEWTPSPLNFTASYIPDPSRAVIGRVAQLAQDVARKS